MKSQTLSFSSVSQSCGLLVASGSPGSELWWWPIQGRHSRPTASGQQPGSSTLRLWFTCTQTPWRIVNTVGSDEGMWVGHMVTIKLIIHGDGCWMWIRQTARRQTSRKRWRTTNNVWIKGHYWLFSSLMAAFSAVCVCVCAWTTSWRTCVFWFSRHTLLCYCLVCSCKCVTVSWLDSSVTRCEAKCDLVYERCDKVWLDS